MFKGTRVTLRTVLASLALETLPKKSSPISHLLNLKTSKRQLLLRQRRRKKICLFPLFL